MSRDDAAPAALEVDGVSKAFNRRTVLPPLDLRVARGEAVVLRGPNGAGKSTLLGIVAGTVAADEGRVRIGGHDLVAAPLQARAALRYLPQEVEVPAGVSGRELIELAAEIHGVRGRTDRAEAVSGLGEALQRYATTYSVGMRRLLGFATLLVGEASLYVLDEPFAGVDADGRARILAALQRVRDDGAGLLLAAHDRDADDVASLSPRRFDVARAPESSGDAPGRDASEGEGREDTGTTGSAEGKR